MGAADTGHISKTETTSSGVGLRHVYVNDGLRFRLSSLPVVVGAVLALGRVGRDSADDLLGVRVHQLDRVDGQVLIEVGPALGCVRTQVTLVLPLLCNETHRRPSVTGNMICLRALIL